MNISELSIKRPVLSTVMVLIIVLFGVIGYIQLGVREYPSVDKPIISVSVSYPGANADVVMNQITEPLEQNINGIPGINSLTSVSSQGSCWITVEFDLEVDMERAANDVRDKVSRAQRYLPRDCDPPTVSKSDADSDPILRIAINGKNHSPLELTEIAELTVKERLQTIQDVSAINIWGKRYAMRLWLNSRKMAGYGITPLDVKYAIDAENVELPSGDLEGENVLLSIRTLGLMTTPEEFNNLVIKEINGKIIRLKDIGWAQLGGEDEKSILRINDNQGVMLMVVPQPGANHIDIADEVYKRIEQMQKDLPEGVNVDIMFDNTKFIRASIGEVENTIYVAFALVIIIIFLFLRDWRVTLVPVAVIPISLIGAFFVMYIAGFSINVLTMLAIVLAVGLVVDDAIVVAENIYIRIENGAKPKEAGIEGSKEIFFAVVSTTITLVSVFLPIVFLEGMTGKLFKEFSIVIAGAVVISSFVALTFTPMLATKLLKRREKKNAFYLFTEPFFVKLIATYEASLSIFLRFKFIALIIITLLIGLTVYLFNKIPSELAPIEDRSQVIVSMLAPEGTTYDYMTAYTDTIAAIMDRAVPERNNKLVRTYTGGGFAFVTLPDIDERIRSQAEIASSLSTMVVQDTRARAFVRQPASLSTGRGGMPVQYVLQATSIDKLREFLPLFMEKVNESPIFRMSDANLKFSKPEVRVEINRDKANQMGVSTRDISQTLQYGLSGQRMGYYYRYGKQYQILAEIERNQRNTPLNLKSIYVRNNHGEMIQLDNLVDTYENEASPKLYRYNRFVSATISAGLADDKTIGDGLDEMDRIAEEVLDDTFRTALSGDSKEFRDSSSSLIFAFILALILIYLVLAAQFESFKDPMIIMFTVPLAIAGALIFMFFGGVTMNIFSQIGIIMLIGLVAKNGILIVEFANQRQDMGLTKADAIMSAATQRFRPILMTSLSTVLGLLPLMFATGEGANSRIAMGVSVVGGLIISTFLTLYVIPAMYSYFSTFRNK